MTGDGGESPSASADERRGRGPGRLKAAVEGELGRRLVHASGAAIPLTYYVLTVGIAVDESVAWQVLQAITVLGVLAAAVLEFVRLRIGLDWWIFEHLTRAYEREKVAGYALYLVGMATVALLFEPAIALTGMFLLAIGDPLSGYLATDSPGLKGPRAVVPALLVGTGIGIVVGLHPAVAAAAAVGLVVADVRLWSIGGYVIDDNLTIPIAAGVAAWLVSLAL